jgi:hypothetical protein
MCRARDSSALEKSALHFRFEPPIVLSLGCTNAIERHRKTTNMQFHFAVFVFIVSAVASTGCGGSSSVGTSDAGDAPAMGGASAGGRASGGSAGGGGVALGGAGGSTAFSGGGGLVTSSGGSGGSSGTGGATGIAGTGGSIGRGGTVGGSGGSGGLGSGGTSGPTRNCGSTTLNQHPLGCKFAWGVADPGGSLAGLSYAQFVSYWVDSSITASGTYSTCNGCKWLTGSVSGTNLIPAYYAYIIGFLAHANGIVDGNQNGGKKLTTDGAALVKANYNAIVNAYAWYAKETAKVWPSKPLIWLLEGDFVQLVDQGQSSPMTYADVGKLAGDITCAIKTNMPNAVVAIDHSTWNSDEVTNSYWGAIDVNYDMVWTTGVGNNDGFVSEGMNSGSYNAKTGTYSYLHSLTGRTILVDTSAGASAASDSWSTASAAQLNARISEGVIAANITGSTSSSLQQNISKISGLSAIPACQ